MVIKRLIIIGTLYSRLNSEKFNINSAHMNKDLRNIGDVENNIEYISIEGNNFEIIKLFRYNASMINKTE